MTQQKLGLATMRNTGVDTVEQIKIFSDVGFQAFFTGWLPDRTEEIANAAARLGIFQQSIHSPFSGEYKVRYLWEGGEEGDFVTNALIDCVNDCARFDIPVMVIHPFIGFKDHNPTEVGLDNYARVIEVANKQGVKLGFENVEGEEYLRAVMERFSDSDAVGFCFDSGHQLCYNANTDMLSLYGDKLIHTHLNDNLGVSGESITWHDDLHLPVGEGKNDWKSVMQKIRATGYNDVLMCELSLTNKPNHNELDRFISMPIEEFYSFSLNALKKVCE